MKETFLKDMMETYQEINTLENGISFTKGGFDQLYKEYEEEENNNSIEKILSLVSGAMIGVGSFMIIDSVKGIMQIRKEMNNR